MEDFFLFFVVPFCTRPRTCEHVVRLNLKDQKTAKLKRKNFIFIFQLNLVRVYLRSFLYSIFINFNKQNVMKQSVKSVTKTIITLNSHYVKRETV